MKKTTALKLENLIRKLIREETGDLSMPYWVIEIGGTTNPRFGEGYDGKYPIVQTFSDKSDAQRFVLDKKKQNSGYFGISYKVVSANKSKLK